MKSGFSTDVSMVRSPNRVLKPLKSASKTRSQQPCATQSLFLDNLHFDHFVKYFNFIPPKTKICEGGTKDEIRMFEALFKGVSTLFGLRTIETLVEKPDFEALFKDVSTQFGPLTIEKVNRNPDFIFCSSFPNLRLGSINLILRLTLLTKWSKWRLSKKRD